MKMMMKMMMMMINLMTTTMTTMLSNTKSRDKEKEDTQCMKIKRGKSKRKNEENACKKTIAAK